MPPAPKDDIFDPNALTKLSRKADLINRLNLLHKRLGEVSQEPLDRPECLEALSAYLISKKILNHLDKDVRLLACCCLVDILRIYAPDAPFNDAEMVVVFDVIVAQIRSLSTYNSQSGTGSKVVYILTSLSTVKSCVVPVILAQSSVPGADELVTSLFDALVSSFRPDHGEEVLGHMCAIMQACIEESDDIDQDVLDLLLAPLLPSARTENPTAYKMVAAVLRRVAGSVEQPISRFVNYVLVGSAAPEKGKNSELAEHVYALIYELHKISPGLLLRILPNVCEQLLAEEEDIRLYAVKLLGQLFASPHADYGVEYKKNFRDFLGRFQDISATVRLEMVDNGSQIMKKKPELKAQIEEFLAKRLRDTEAEIRLRAVTRLFEVAADSPLNLSSATFVELGERAKDRRPEVRKLVVTNLAKLYHTHVSSKLPPIAELLEGDGVGDDDNISGQEDGVATARGMFAGHLRQGVLERLSIVPSIVINAWGYPELATRHMLLQLLQECMLPKSVSISVSENDPSEADSSDQSQGSGSGSGSSQQALAKTNKQGKSAVAKSRASSLSVSRSKAVSAEVEEALDAQRASALLLLYTVLNKTDRDSLGTILGYKTKVKNDVAAFIDARAYLAESDAADQPAAAIQLKRVMLKLVQTLPTPDKKIQLLEKLHAVKDKTVFRLLARAVDAKDGILKSCDYREDLKQRLDSKSLLGEYIGVLFDSAAFMVAHQGVVSALVAFASEANLDTAAGLNASALLALLAKHASLSYSGASDSVGKWVSHSVQVYDNAVAELKSARKDLNQAKTKSAAKKDALEHALLVYKEASGLINQTVVVLSFAAPALAADEVDSDDSLCRALVGIALRDSDLGICEKIGEAAAKLALLAEPHTPHRRSSVSLSHTGRGSSSSSSSASASASSSSENRNPVVAAIHSLSSDKRLSLSNKRLAHDLTTLAALVRIPLTTSNTADHSARYAVSDTYAAALDVREKVLDFVLSEMVHSDYTALSDSLSAATVAVTISPPKKKSSKTKKATKKRGNFEDEQEEEEDEEQETVSFADSAERDESAVGKALSAGITAWTAFVMSNAEAKQRRDSRDSLGSSLVAGKEDGDEDDEEGSAGGGGGGLSEELAELCDALFDCLNTKGAKFGKADIDSANEQVLVYESAALSALNLMKLQSFGRFLSAERWHQLGWTLLCPNESVRTKLLARLGQVIQTSVVHPRFLAYPCLLATDDALAHKSEQSLLFAVRRLRSTHEALCGRALAEDSDYLRTLAQNNMPETILPYVLHLLSYHPGFPQSANAEDSDDKARIRGIVRNVRMVLGVLMSTLKDGLGNLSYLLKQVNMILQNYEDTLDGANLGIHWVCRLSLKLLKEQIKTADNVLPYPGDIRLPEELFRLRKNEVFEGREVTEAVKGLEGAEEAIDKALHGRGAGGALGKARGRMRRDVLAARPQQGARGGQEEEEELNEQGSEGEEDEISPKKQKQQQQPKKQKQKRASPGAVTAAPAAARAPVPAPAPVPARVSTRPQRNATRTVSSYAEVDEREDEANKWDRAAIEAKRRSSSPAKASKSASRDTDDSGGRRTSSSSIYDPKSQDDSPKMRHTSPSSSQGGLSAFEVPSSQQSDKDQRSSQSQEDFTRNRSRGTTSSSRPSTSSPAAAEEEEEEEDKEVEEEELRVSPPAVRKVAEKGKGANKKRPSSVLQSPVQQLLAQKQANAASSSEGEVVAEVLPKRQKLSNVDKKNVTTTATTTAGATANKSRGSGAGAGETKISDYFVPSKGAITVATVPANGKKRNASAASSSGSGHHIVEPVTKGVDENASPVPTTVARTTPTAAAAPARGRQSKAVAMAAAAKDVPAVASKRVARPIRA